MRAWLLCLGLVATSGCSGDEPGDDDGVAGQNAATAICLPGAQSSCACAGSSFGIQVCNATGSGYAACQCPMASVGGSSGTGGAPPTMVGSSGSGGVTASGGTGGATTIPPVDAGKEPDVPVSAPLASGIKIAELAIYQPVKVSLVKAGAPVIERNAPLIVQKPALLRVSLEPLSGWTARDVVVELTLNSSEGAAEPQSATKRVMAASSDDTLDSTVNFDIPAEAMTADLRYSVAVREMAGATASGTADPTARFPATEGELAPLSPRDAGPLRVMFVPYRYKADGSDRLPDTDQAQMDLLRDYLYTFYPASDIEVQMHEPVDYNSAVGPNTGWEQWLDFHCALREDENSDPKVMYYGAMSMRASLQAYGGGIIGISYVPTAAGNYGRCSVGVGWKGNLAASTMAHELGHALGLPHAPCGVDGGPYPYADAKIGIWGYSFKDKELRDPAEYHDMMSYCDPSFISDFNFERIFERIRYLNLQFDMTPSVPASYVRVLAAGGQLSVRGRTSMQRAPGAEDQQRTITLLDAAGNSLRQTTAYFFPMSEAGSGTWLIPDSDAAAARIDGAGTVVLR